MVIGYSPNAAKALARLKTQYNDIEIFVEDTKNSNMWIELIKTIVPNNIKITSVNQLGGRQKVIDACKLDQENDGRRKLYIIDGDFDHLLGRRKPNLKHLYRLRAYCVENLLVGEQNALYLGIPSNPNLSLEMIKRRFDYESWHSTILDQLGPLFTLYAAANRLTPAIQTTAYSVSQLYLAGGGQVRLCESKLFKRKLSLAKAIRQHTTASTLRSTIEEIHSRATRLGMMECISGKDYVFPLFALRVRAKLQFKGDNEQIKVHLARSFKPYQEPWLAKRISEICAQ
ncbi:MAG: DUF4435 domain-containing protein [bacterium]|jgi:hypothetical protein